MIGHKELINFGCQLGGGGGGGGGRETLVMSGMDAVSTARL